MGPSPGLMLPMWFGEWKGMARKNSVLDIADGDGRDFRLSPDHSAPDEARISGIFDRTLIVRFLIVQCV